MPRERIPLETHRLRGSRPQYVTPASVAHPGRPRYPKGLSPDAKRTFKNLCRLLEQRRSLTEGDGELLRLVAINIDRHAKACAKVAEEGEIKVYFRLDKHGEQVPSEKPNLWLEVACNAEKFIQSALRDLGLTPGTRGKVKPTEEPKKPEVPDSFPTREEAAAAATEPEPDLTDIHEETIQ